MALSALRRMVMESQPIQERRSEEKRPLLWGLIFGIVFGALLHRGGVTDYGVIVGQLLLEDFTVIKVMLSAVLTGMIGVYFMKTLGWIELHPKSGSLGASVIGGLIFGIGFATLGYCPGTVAGALGNGSIDALFGILGILIGAGLFASVYPGLKNRVLGKGDWGDITLPRLLRVNDWVVVLPVGVLIYLLLYWLEVSGR
jgi:hypothetical protein